jgi:hypothetical protein
MEISKVFVTKTELKDLSKGLSSQHFYAEVVLVEQNHGHFYPQLYQLKGDPLTPIESLEKLRQEFTPLDRDSFIQIGEISHVDSNKKLVFLADQTLVSYKYMIIVSSQQNVELSSVISTLKDALLLDAMNVQDKINSSSHFSERDLSQNHCVQSSLSRSEEHKSIGEVVQPHLSNTDAARLTSLSSFHTRYCQVKK